MKTMKKTTRFLHLTVAAMLCAATIAGWFAPRADAATLPRLNVQTSAVDRNKPKPVSFPDPKDVTVERDGYKVVALPKLIELKLASGLSAPHRISDLADVQDLIGTLDLPHDLAEDLDPSVSDEYLRMWDVAATARDPQSE